MGHQFELLIVLLGVVVAIGVLASYIRVAYPILLVVAGLLLSLQDWAPKYELPPEIVLFAFLPPLLYAAAFNTHWPCFRKQLRSISLLAFGLVFFTTAVVAILCHEVMGLPWPVGFLLGAIISPPDAVAATAITQRVRVPRIVATILEGESLVNDASALVAYRVALAVVGSGVFSFWDAAGQLAFVSAGGIAIGLAGAWLASHLHRWLERTKLGDAKINIAITLLTPFALYLPAEHLHVSGVLAVVSAGLWMGWRAERLFSRDLMIEARAVWEMLEFLLNGLIFILIGFQLHGILEDLSKSAIDIPKLLWWAFLLCSVVIVTRLAWVFPLAYVLRWLDRLILGHGDPYPPWQSVSVVGWTGMRGVVSLAAAMAIPTGLDDLSTPFPDRPVVIFLTFCVIFATLVGQGLTLPLLIRVLKVDRIAEAEGADHEAPTC